MLFRLFAVLFYAALGVCILSFIFSNRDPIVLNLQGMAIELPAYVALAAMFAAGLLLGLLHSFTVWFSNRRSLRIARRSIAQLEQELATRPPGSPAP